VVLLMLHSVVSFKSTLVVGSIKVLCSVVYSCATKYSCLRHIRWFSTVFILKMHYIKISAMRIAYLSVVSLNFRSHTEKIPTEKSDYGVTILLDCNAR
jgi:hypothetical protein